MNCTDAVDLVSYLLEVIRGSKQVKRGQKRSKEVKFKYYSQRCNILWTCSYDTLKYYRLCYFDLRDQQRSLDVISEVIRGYWRSKEVKIRNYSQGCNFLWTFSYDSPKYHRLCYFDPKTQQRSLNVILGVIKDYWRSIFCIPIHIVPMSILPMSNNRSCLPQRLLEVIGGQQRS